MPELPEVEIVRRGLAPAMEGGKFADVTLNRPDLRFPFGDRFAERLRGAYVCRLWRRAKYIVVETNADVTLAIHLGMTGRFTIAPPGIKLKAAAEDTITEPGQIDGERAFTPGEFYYNHGADPKHDHVVFKMSDGAVIRYNDVRRFGYMTLIETGGVLAEHALFKKLGAEPLSDELSPDYLARHAKGKAQSLKAFLLDQHVVAGLGNIYVCEALFRAGIPPLSEAGMLAKGKRGKAAATRLCDSIKGVLNDALDAGGSSFRDYRHADGGSGQFQDKFSVYGRRGETCLKGCGSTIERVVQQGRSTFFCPTCQGKL